MKAKAKAPSIAWAKYAAEVEAKLKAQVELNLKQRARIEALELRLAAEPPPSSIRLELDPAREGFLAFIPPAPGSVLEHALNVSLLAAGPILQRILRAQSAASETRQYRVGSIASPTQAMVEEWGETNRIKRYNERGQSVLDMTGVEL